MGQSIIIALRVTLVTLVLTGILYPLAATGVEQLLFPKQANGSLVVNDKGNVIGSELIGQPFSKPSYFQPRISAAGDKGYDATASSGSNFGPTSKKLHDRVQADIERLTKENPEAPGPVPSDLVTASASGLDPHLSPDAARWQIPRVAKARGITQERIRDAVAQAIEGRDLGLFGEPRVNVLLLNLALDRQFGGPAQ
jgi:K+-transporting ATPase ATPase C chain